MKKQKVKKLKDASTSTESFVSENMKVASSTQTDKVRELEDTSTSTESFVASSFTQTDAAPVDHRQSLLFHAGALGFHEAINIIFFEKVLQHSDVYDEEVTDNLQQSSDVTE